MAGLARVGARVRLEEDRSDAEAGAAPPTGLAPGELEWMYNPSLDPKNRLGADVVDLLGRIAPCRDARCAVPERHPFYHAEVLGQAGDSYGFRVPCMPVVPVLTNRKQLFVMGDYPTAKFTARSTDALPVITGSTEAIAADNSALRSFLDAAGAQPHGEPHLLADLHRGDRRSDPRRRRAAGRERLARTAVVRSAPVTCPSGRTSSSSPSATSSRPCRTRTISMATRCATSRQASSCRRTTSGPPAST